MVQQEFRPPGIDFREVRATCCWGDPEVLSDIRSLPTEESELVSQCQSAAVVSAQASESSDVVVGVKSISAGDAAAGCG